MAGIGIRLNRIFSKDSQSLGRVIYGSVYSTLATIAPMLLVIGALLLMYVVLGFSTVGYFERELFACTVLYVFIFSLITASPFNSVLSKYVGDRIFEERYDDILPCVYVGLALHESFACLLGIPFCLWEYFVGGVDAYYVITGFLAYAFLGLAFDFMLYLSILKLYRQLSLFFFLGMLLTFLLSLLFRFVFRWSITYSMLAALALGFFLIAVLELGFLKTYFHDNSRCYREVFGYFGTYWKLMLSNFFYVLGLFVHNFVFWTKEDMNLRLVDTFVCNQPYDMASCIAMFTNISASVIFIANVEMKFHARYQAYTEAVLGGRLRDIRQAKSRMFRLLSEQVVRMVQLQFIVSVVFFLLCLILLPRVGMSGLVMTIYPCMAAGYFALFLMYSVMLYLQYFNDLTGCVLTGGLFCAAVLAGSILCLQLPAYWYALGVFAGSVLGFSFAYFRVRWVERHLDEHIFCRGSLLQEKREPMPSAAVYTWLSQEEDAHEA